MRSQRCPGFTLMLISLLLIPSSAARAQEVVAAGVEHLESDEEMLRKTEAEVRLLISKEFVGNRLDRARKVERQLTKILYLYPDTPFRGQVEENLSQVQEMLGLHILQVARFYFNRPGFSKLKGAESRLLQIVREYPRFSQMAEVLLLLGKVYRRTEQLEDATNYFWKLICQHPTSQHVNEAYQQLSEIGFDATKGCDNLKP